MRVVRTMRRGGTLAPRLMLDYGLHRSEVVLMFWDDYDFATPLFTVVGKGDKLCLISFFSDGEHLAWVLHRDVRGFENGHLSERLYKNGGIVCLRPLVQARFKRDWVTVVRLGSVNASPVSVKRARDAALVE